jgi:cytochrome P450
MVLNTNAILFKPGLFFGLIALLAFSSASLYVLYYIFIIPLRSPLRHLPSPHQRPVWLRLFSEPRVPELEKWVDELPYQGLIRYFGAFNRERIFVPSPAGVKDLLYTEAYKFVKPELQHILAANIAGKGLLIQEGYVHKMARKNFQPAFHADRIRQGYPSIWKTTIETMDAVSEQSSKSHLEDGRYNSYTTLRIIKPISAASIDIIGNWGFGTSFNAVKNPKAGFGRSYIEMFKTTERGQKALELASIIGPKAFMSLPFRAAKTIAGVMDLVRRTAEDIVTEHEQSFRMAEKSIDKCQLVSDNDMLSRIMKTTQFSHQDLVEQTVHFLAAATETVAGSICWTIHLLSRHPDMQSRLREEIRQQLPSPVSTTTDGSVQESNFESLKYLNAVIQETLRYHSINTLLWRECVSPAKILGTSIPKGTTIVYSPWVSNRNPRHWGSDSRTFDPERWLRDSTGSGGADSSYSFLTFGAGPRRCIGEQYARAQMRCILAGLIGRFEFLPISPDKGSDEGQEIGDNAALTLFKILDGWKIKVKELEGW